MTKQNLINIINHIDRKNESQGVISYNHKYIYVLKALINIFEEEGDLSKANEFKNKLSLAESLK